MTEGWEAKAAYEGPNIIGFRVRWSQPNPKGEYLYVRHYMMGEDGDPSLSWCLNAAEGDAQRLNQEDRRPQDYHCYQEWIKSGEENMMPSPNKPDRHEPVELPPNMKFNTGAMRGTDATKTRYDLIPPSALQAWAEAFAEGVDKYGLHNWLKGIPSSNALNHALRHIYLYLDGDRSEDHLGHALWNIGVAVHNDRHRPSLVDMPPYRETNESPTNA